MCFPNCHDKVAPANDIARYFHRKILNIRNELDGIDVTQNRCGDLIDDPVFSSNLEPLRVFNELTEKDVYQLIQASAKKSCMLDPLQLPFYRPALKNSFQESLLWLIVPWLLDTFQLCGKLL